MAIMAQIGSFVPAKSARIGIVDKGGWKTQNAVCAHGSVYPDPDSGVLYEGANGLGRVKTSVQLMRQPSSAFMIDLSQVSMALRGATSRSLIILDEFGKGDLRIRLMVDGLLQVRLQQTERGCSRA